MSVCAAFLCKRTLPYNQSAPPVTSHHPPGQAVALSVVVAEVSHFAVLDVQPCLPHVVPSPAIARFTGVGDDLRDRADVRPTTRMAFLVAVSRRVPPEHLREGARRKGWGGRLCRFVRVVPKALMYSGFRLCQAISQALCRKQALTVQAALFRKSVANRTESHTQKESITASRARCPSLRLCSVGVSVSLVRREPTNIP